MRLGNLIRKWRTGEGKSCNQVAKEIGISQSVLHRIETGGQGNGKQKGSVEMNGATLTKILVWLLNTERQSAPGVLAVVAILLTIGLFSGQAGGQYRYNGNRSQSQQPIQVGDLMVGTCDSIQMNTEMGATEVMDPTGNGVNEFDANAGLDLCMAQMVTDTQGNTYIIADNQKIFGFDALGNLLLGPMGRQQELGQEQHSPDDSGNGRLPRLSTILHDQRGNFYLIGSDGKSLSRTAGPDGDAQFFPPGSMGSRFALMPDQHNLVYVSLSTGAVRMWDLANIQDTGVDLIPPSVFTYVPYVLADGSIISLGSDAKVTHWAGQCAGCGPYQLVKSYTQVPLLDNIVASPDGVSWYGITVSYDAQNEQGGGQLYQVSVAGGSLLGTIDLCCLDYGRYYSSSLGVYGNGLDTQTQTPVKPIKFGKLPVPVGASVLKTVAVKNTGNVQMVISALGVVAVDGDHGEWSVTANQCQKGVKPGTHCNVKIQYTATRVGQQGGQLVVYANIPGGSAVTALVGAGK